MSIYRKCQKDQESKAEHPEQTTQAKPDNHTGEGEKTTFDISKVEAFEEVAFNPTPTER